MPGRSRVKGFIEDTAGELLRVLMHPSPIEVPSIENPDAKEIDTSIQVEPGTASLQISPNAESISVDITPQSVETMPSIHPEVTARMDPPTGICNEMPILRPEGSVVKYSPSPVECSSVITPLDLAEIPAECLSTSFRFKPAHACRSAFKLPESGWVVSANLARNAKSRQNIDLAVKYPVILKATPWPRMERGFLIACWELLRGQVKEECGVDPGRSLEMLAVFSNVQLGLYSRSSFDPVMRELRLYPFMPGERRGNEVDYCAIIIGNIQGTSRLLQAILNYKGG